jgi:transcriptional regulator with XRE-family HTH domain
LPYTKVNTPTWLYKQYTHVHNMHMSISKNLQREMDRVGVTQYSLEKLSKVPQPTIQRILKGSDPKASTVKKLAVALGVPSSVILDEGFNSPEIYKIAEKNLDYDSPPIHPLVIKLNMAINSGKLSSDELNLVEALSTVLVKTLN